MLIFEFEPMNTNIKRMIYPEKKEMKIDYQTKKRDEEIDQLRKKRAKRRDEEIDRSGERGEKMNR